MAKPDPIEAVRQTQPTTKAARLRDVMPEIEKKLAVGVQLRTIHQALTGAGFDLTLQTLKTYLYRYRKQLRAKPAGQQTGRAGAPPVGTPVSSQGGESVSIPAQLLVAQDSLETTPSREPISMQELDRLMKPDPAKQAEDLARYERLAKQKERSRK